MRNKRNNRPPVFVLYLGYQIRIYPPDINKGKPAFWVDTEIPQDHNIAEEHHHPGKEQATIIEHQAPLAPTGSIPAEEHHHPHGNSPIKTRTESGTTDGMPGAPIGAVGQEAHTDTGQTHTAQRNNPMAEN